MCGIYGVIELGQGRRPTEDVLARMGNIIAHRGPDDFGHYAEAELAFGMRRLSIIDVGGGHQPILNETGTVAVICNGEIYNFKELRRDLEARGHVFRCDSDVEVIVHLYEEKGLEFLKQLRGMFAIALWDAERSRLVLARDRLGKKPLYLSRESNRILFASEIKSILTVWRSSPNINLTALREYLALGYVPAPLTLFDGIEKLLPGYYTVIENGHISSEQYWDVPQGKFDNYSENDWIERVREKLLECIRLRLVSDVPLGSFLSGGIDSSAIVAGMASMMDQPVKTYSIGFDGADSYYNELPYARIVAKAFATDHHEIIARPEIAHLLPKLVWHLDEPLADSASVTTFLVSRLAGQSVKVILSGVGGDELFGGYRRYLGDRLLHYYRWLPESLKTKWLPAFIGALPQDRNSAFKNYVRYADGFVKSAQTSQVSRYTSYVTLFSKEIQSLMLAKDPATDEMLRDVSRMTSLDKYFDAGVRSADLSRLIYVDLKTSLPDDLLALTDKMTMAASLECRAPFVDHELVELAARIPDSLKIRGLSMKYLLKKAVAAWLPKEIVNRKKRGFGAPIGSWLRDDLGPLMDTLLSETQVKQRGLFDYDFIKTIIASHNAQEKDYTDQLLALINLELWAQIFIDGRDYREFSELVSGVNAN